MLRVTMANVAGGRLVDRSTKSGYAPHDRTEEFAAALAAGGPDILIITELDCGPGSQQLDQLAERALGQPPEATAQHAWSPSHIPGVRRLGVGIASRYPLHDITRVDLPDPPFDMLHWSTGEKLEWHPKGLLVSRCQTPEGDVHIVGGQIHPIHMARSAEGVEYSYREGVGREFGRELSDFLSGRLTEIGVERAIIAGDLNMPDPREFFAYIGDTALADVFGSGIPPATTPDGRSIDRAFITENLGVRGYQVSPLPGADHYPVGFEVEIREAGTAPPKGVSHRLYGAPGISPAHLRKASGPSPRKAEIQRKPAAGPDTPRRHR